MNRKQCQLLTVFTLLIAATSAQAVTFTPPWTRNVDTVNTTFQHWDHFTDLTGPNAPDVVDFNAYGTAGLVETGPLFSTFPPPMGEPPQKIITSTGNIYSFSRAMQFEVDVPHGGTGDLTTVLLQTRTQASTLDLDSFMISYDDGSGAQIMSPLADALVHEETIMSAFGPASVSDRAFLFNVPAVPPTLTFTFNAQTDNMSLDQVMIDTIVTTANEGFVDVVFTEFETPVPEPASAGLLACGALALLSRRRSLH